MVKSSSKTENLQEWLFQEDQPELKTTCKEVPLPLNNEDKIIMEKLIRYVKWSQNPAEHNGLCDRPAVGIAANQIGINKQMYYIRFKSPETNEIIEHAIINGKIVARSETKSYLPMGEGCLSVIKRSYFHGISVRNFIIEVEGYNYFTQKNLHLHANNFEAIVFQHEQDHLIGKLFYDRINSKNPKYIDDNWIKIER